MIIVYLTDVIWSACIVIWFVNVIVDLQVCYEGSWSASMSRIKLIRKLLADQVDQQGTRRWTWSVRHLQIKLIRSWYRWSVSDLRIKLIHELIFKTYGSSWSASWFLRSVSRIKLIRKLQTVVTFDRNVCLRPIICQNAWNCRRNPLKNSQRGFGQLVNLFKMLGGGAVVILCSASSSRILLNWRLAVWWWCFTDQLDLHIDFKVADQVDLWWWCFTFQ